MKPKTDTEQNLKPETEKSCNLKPKIKPNITEIKARCEAATEGPWLPYHGVGLHCVTDSKPDGKHKFSNRICEYTYRYGEEQNHRDVDFIAHARQDIPDLLKYIDELEGKLEKAVKVIEFYGDGDSWGHESPSSTSYSVIDKEDMGIGEFHLNELTDDYRVGGLRARKFLEGNK